MTTKYHIGKNGPAVCKATKRACKLGQHYEDIGDANIAFAQQLEKTPLDSILSQKRRLIM